MSGLRIWLWKSPRRKYYKSSRFFTTRTFVNLKGKKYILSRWPFLLNFLWDNFSLWNLYKKFFMFLVLDWHFSAVFFQFSFMTFFSPLFLSPFAFNSLFFFFIKFTVYGFSSTAALVGNNVVVVVVVVVEAMKGEIYNLSIQYECEKNIY